MSEIQFISDEFVIRILVLTIRLTSQTRITSLSPELSTPLLQPTWPAPEAVIMPPGIPQSDHNGLLFSQPNQGPVVPVQHLSTHDADADHGASMRLEVSGQGDDQSMPVNAQFSPLFRLGHDVWTRWQRSQTTRNASDLSYVYL